MKKNSYLNFSNKISSKKNNKYIYILLIFSIIFSSIVYENYKYNRFIDQFKHDFTNYDYAKANNLLITNQQYNPFRIFCLKEDLNIFFDSELSRLSKSLEDQSCASEDILWELNEIERYDIIPFDKINNIAASTDLLKESIKNYTEGINCFDDENYTSALSYFEQVSSLDLNYGSSLKYMDKSRSYIEQNLFAYCDELISNDYYSKAISILTENNLLIKNDIDVQNKISEIKDKQQDYYNKTSEIIEASSQALTSSINPSNINTLNIQSDTSYLINVDLNNQKTYVYRGNKDNWSLVKTCPCSTGIDGEETPTGSFSTQEKGDWFFSNQYKQGGKYWTQIVGDILFHSVPFDSDKTTVLDYTLNKPASHGCIRLSIDDSKWIYNNIPKGSKVIIK